MGGRGLRWRRRGRPAAPRGSTATSGGCGAPAGLLRGKRRHLEVALGAVADGGGVDGRVEVLEAGGEAGLAERRVEPRIVAVEEDARRLVVEGRTVEGAETGRHIGRGGHSLR